MLLVSLKIEIGAIVLHLIRLEIQIIVLRRVQDAVDGFQARITDRSHWQPIHLIRIIRRINLQMIVEHPAHAIHSL